MEQDSFFAVAKYDYKAESEGELTIRKNEKLTIIDDSQPWWKVQNDKREAGYVPSNYLNRKDSVKGKKNIIDNLKGKVLKNKRTSLEDVSIGDGQSPKMGNKEKVLMMGSVKFKYVPQRDDELELNPGDAVYVYEMEHDGWCRGEITGKVGWFPLNYIQKVERGESAGSDDLPDTVTEKPIICKVRTLYPFTSQTCEELSFHKDIILEVVDMPKDDPDWYQARKSTGEMGLIPRNYVETIVSPVLTPGPTKPKPSLPDLSKVPNNQVKSPPVAAVAPIVNNPAPVVSDPYEDRPWYFGGINRKEGEKLLKDNNQDGQYLVRQSESKPGDYSLSMKAPDRIKHFKIEYQGSEFKIGQRTFDNLDDLISHYLKSPIYTTDSGQKMYLTTVPMK